MAVIVLSGTFEGTFRSTREMEVDQAKYNKYLADNPEFDIEDMEDVDMMWDFFKHEYNCYDEIVDSVDYDTTLTEMEVISE